MTTITPAIATPTLEKPIPATETGSGTAITSDFETFLTLLTAQIENQDPLEPMKSDEFATQLATFSGVEQQVLTNDLLKTLTGREDGASLSGLATWIGRDVRSTAPAMIDGTAHAFHPPAAPAGTRHEIVFRNAAGAEVHRLPADGAGTPVVWDGAIGTGFAPRGLYSAELESFENAERIANVPVESFARVTEIRIADGAPGLVIEGGTTLDPGDVTALREAGV